MARTRQKRNWGAIKIASGAIVLIGTIFFIVGTARQKTSNDSRRKQDLHNISKAMEIYYNDFQHYPYSFQGAIIGCGESASQICTWGEVWQNSNDKKVYMSTLPVDPRGTNYYYVSDAQGKTFSVFALLENTKDSDTLKNAAGESTFYNGTYCRTADGTLSADTCNYVVSSENSKAIGR